MAIKNRKCLSCQTAFSYCPDCSSVDRLAPAWRAEFCCEDCKNIWTTATKFNMNKLTKAEAKSVISELNLKPIDQYVACVQRDLKVILAEESKPKRTKKTEIKLPTPVVQPTIIEEAIPVEIFVSTEEVSPAVEETHHEVVNKTEEE